MPKIYCVVKNDIFVAKLSSATVYVFNKAETELLAKFKTDYAYKAEFVSGKNILVAKGTLPNIYIYDLDKMILVKRFHLHGNNQPQDDGFCISSDGKWLYNIEYMNDLLSQINIFDLEALSFVKNVKFEDSGRYAFQSIFAVKKGYEIYGFNRHAPSGVAENFYKFSFDGNRITEGSIIEFDNYRRNDYITIENLNLNKYKSKD